MTEAAGLADKARWFDNYVQERFLDDSGAVYSRINVQTGKPFVPEDLPPEADYLSIEGFTIPEVINYEDSGIASGSYLAALAYRYLATGEPVALAQARRVFDGICWIYDLGRSKEEGYFPKPYGGRCSEETSSDQYLYVMKGMMVYRRIAAADHLERIRRMIPAMADFWTARDYRRTYFGIDNMQWPIGRFACFAIMAYVVSGEQKYLDEFNRLNDELGVCKRPWDSQVYTRQTEWPGVFSEYEMRQGKKYLLACTGDCAAMEIMSLDECLACSSSHWDDRKRIMKIMWEEGKLILADNGYAYMKVLYDPETRQVTVPTEAGFAIEPEKLQIAWSFEGWIGKVYMPRSTMLARVAVNVYHWLGLEEARTLLIKILAGIRTDMLTDYIPADEKQMLPQHVFLTKQVCGVSVTNWLWAYWQGRYENLNPE